MTQKSYGDRDRTQHKEIAGTIPMTESTWKAFVQNGVVKQVDHSVEVTQTRRVYRNVECYEGCDTGR